MNSNKSIKYYCWHTSPIGHLLVAGCDEALRYIGFPEGNRKGKVDDQWEENNYPFREACKQLDDYFDRRRTSFDLPLSPAGTQFQQLVWTALMGIPYGTTTSYAGIASQINRPTATRAVGNANGRNPIPIIIPCHRVIGRDGTLTGFGGGLPTKNFLLQLENSDQLALPF